MGHRLWGKAVPCTACTMQFARTFENFNPEPGTEGAVEAAHAFLAGELKWLVMIGVPGCGKTHLLHAIRAEKIKRYEDVLYRGVPDLMDSIKAGFDDHTAEDKLTECQAIGTLLLDDLGAGRDIATPWVKEQVYRILNYRYERGKPTVVTTNLDFEAMVSTFDARLASRLFDRNIGVQVSITAKDFRTGRAW